MPVEGSKLVIDGREYPMPDLSDMTMGDARIIKRYTGRTLSELEQLTGDDPDLMGALCHIALVRENPRSSFEQVERLVNAVKIAKLDIVSPPEEEVVLPPDTAPSVNGDDGSRSGATSGGHSAETPGTSLLPTGAPV